jgi:hypothetical protein
MMTEMTDMAAKVAENVTKCDCPILTLLALVLCDGFFVTVLLSQVAELQVVFTAWPARARLLSAFVYLNSARELWKNISAP